MTNQAQIAALPNADETLKRSLLSLPRGAASFVLSALSAASWFMAPLNLLNFLTGLKSAAELWAKLIAWCAHLPFNAAALMQGLESGLNFVFGPWRALIAPLRDWLSDYLPRLPHFAADLLLMALISLPAFLRLVFNFLSANMNAVGLVNGVEKIVELGEPNDPLNAEINAELHGARRLDVLQNLILRRSHEWSDASIAALQDTVQILQSGGEIDPQSPAAQARSLASTRGVAASRTAVHVTQLSLARIHIRSSLKLLRFTAILSLIGAAIVALDYFIR